MRPPRRCLISELDPFIHMDQMGEVEHARRAEEDCTDQVFETVTDMIDAPFSTRIDRGGSS